MGFFNPTTEERAEKERQKSEKKRRKSEAAQQARAAKLAGMKIFQIDLPLSQTKGYTRAMEGAYTDSTKTRDYSSTIQFIEEEGWRLDHVGYVYRITGIVSRDKFWSSGQQVAVSGEIVGIYTFRAT